MIELGKNVMMSHYVINLDRDTQRWNNCEIQAQKFGLELTRVSAISVADLRQNIETFVTSGVRAVWLSHMKCFELRRIKLRRRGRCSREPIHYWQTLKK